MNDNAKLWLDTLRGDQYKQGRTALVKMELNEIQHCCLGVACDLYLKAGNSLEYKPPTPKAPGYYEKERVLLPKAVQAWLGLISPNGSFRKKPSSIAEMNDTGFSFKEIANIVSSRPEDFFNK